MKTLEVGDRVSVDLGNVIVDCEVLAKKAGPMMLDTSSNVGSAVIRSTTKLRLRPAAGGSAFWTAPMVERLAGEGA